MYWLIETKQQLQVFKNSGYKKAFVEVIPYNTFSHPINNITSIIYIRPLESSKGFMLPLDHSETFNLDENVVLDILKQYNTLYCRDKKDILHYLPLSNLWDINLPPNNLDFNLNPTQEYYIKQYPKQNNINTIIPIVKHYQYCEEIYNELKNNINKTPTEYDNFFNTKSSIVFNYIERRGIKVDRNKFSEHFYKISDDKCFTQYNLKTITTRPSNSFGGVNFAALSKKDNSRSSFIPQNDYFLELDISAYHPTLISFLIKYKFDNHDVHEHFAKLYNTTYQQAKELTFKQLYGGVFDEYKDLEFFAKTEQYKTTLYKQYQNKGYVEVPISKYRIDKQYFGDIKKSKLFNYVLQATETSLNILILWDIIKLLHKYKTKIVLYVYDSILLDIDKQEEFLIEEIKQIFTKYKLNTKEKKGNDYNF